MRIPTYVLQEVDRKASQYDISRNEFINQCITFALSHMDDAPAQTPGRGRAGRKKEE